MGQHGTKILVALRTGVQKEREGEMKFLGLPISGPTYIPETAWLRHGPFAKWLVHASRPQIIVELGSHYGFSYFSFCEAVDEARLPTKCFAVDTWLGDEHAGFYGEEVFEAVQRNNFRYRNFSKTIRMTFKEALSEFDDNSVDILHIDGRHYYSDVKEDFEDWIPKLSNRAIVLFHDTKVYDRNFGVHAYWEEISQEKPSINFPYQHGLGVLFWGSDPASGVKPLRDLALTGHGEQAIIDFFSMASEVFINNIYTKKILACAESNEDGLIQTISHTQIDELSDVAKQGFTSDETTALAQLLSSSLTKINEKQKELSASISENEWLRDDLRKQRAANAHIALELSKAARLLRAPILNSIQRNSAKFALKHLKFISGDRARKLKRSIEKREYRTIINTVRQLDSGGTSEDRTSTQTSISAIPAEVPTPAYEFCRANTAETPDSVDIVICIHNALEDVKRCLASIQRNTTHPYRLILVDDGSGAETRDYLIDFSREHGAKLLRSDEATGYTFAANRGMRVVEAAFFVLLNSDTEVTEQWLENMLNAMLNNPDIAIAGPLSNTASWQSAPKLEEGGDWAENQLPDGFSANDIAKIVTENGDQHPIPVGFLNGFCMLVRRQAAKEIGEFDEQTFGAGYGEENDYCIRARLKGWKLAVVEDSYVYHHQSRSYGHDRRKVLAEQAGEKLAAKYNMAVDIAPFVEDCRFSVRLAAARSHLHAGIKSQQEKARAGDRFFGKRVGFFLPVSAAGGGANVIHQEAKALRTFGCEPVIFNWQSNREKYEAAYPELDIPIIYLADASWRKIAPAPEVDALIATHWSSVEVVRHISRDNVIRGYYIQDFEPKFYPIDSDNYRAALSTYIDANDLVSFTKTRWNKDEVVSAGGCAPIILGPSVDLSSFTPREDAQASKPRRVRIAAMIRPSTPYRSPHLTGRVLSQLSEKFGDSIHVSCFGASIDEMHRSGIPLHGVFSYGTLSPTETASLLGQTDIFLDFSEWQAMGLTALEAMASGAAIVAPIHGGAREFCVDGFNSLLVDTISETACFEAASRLISDHALRRSVRVSALESVAEFPPEVCASRLLFGLFG